MKSMSLFQSRVSFLVYFLALYQPAIGSTVHADVNNEDTKLNWSPFMWRGEILRRNRWLSYAIRGRFHSPEDPWVYDCRVQDMQTDITVLIRHFFTRKIALNMTVDLLFQKLESMGVVPKVIGTQPGGLNVQHNPDHQPERETERESDREPNAEVDVMNSIDEAFTSPQQEHGTEVAMEGTLPIPVASKGFENADQLHVVSLAFDGDDDDIRSYRGLNTEGNVTPALIILLTCASVVLTAIVFGIFCKLYFNSKKLPSLREKRQETTDIPLEESVVPDSDGSYKHLSVQEATPSISQLNPSENYVLFESREKGLVYILNNNCFLRRSPKTRQRRGSKVDVSNARHVFTEIGYEPVVYQNLSAEATLTSLDELVTRINAEGARHSSVVLVFMSHGDRRGILGNDENVITVREITDKLSGRRCPALVGKPKILFFQACRGQNVTESATDTDSSPINDGDLSDREAETESLLPARSERLAPYRPQVDVDGDVPNNADMFVAFATSEGNFSFRDCKHGSWFIQALCEELLSNAHLDDLDTIMNKVTGRVIKYIAFVKGEFGRKQKSLQTPEISKKGITKKIFFMPKFPPKEHGD